MRTSYWSCSKFADCLRGRKKIRSGTLKDWDTWHVMAKKKPFRYWLAENGLDTLQDIVYWPKDFLISIICYLDNRFFVKSHVFTSKLKKGEYYDFATRMLHTSFDELIDFVEIETARHHMICLGQKPCKKRDPKAGIAHLKWEMGLKQDDDKNQATRQAVSATETLFLYQWWKELRPCRPCPYEASGLAEYQKTHPINTDLSSCLKDEELQKMYDQMIKIEDSYDAEDTEMLIRLVKLRNALWT